MILIIIIIIIIITIFIRCDIHVTMDQYKKTKYDPEKDIYGMHTLVM